MNRPAWLLLGLACAAVGAVCGLYRGCCREIDRAFFDLS